MAAFTTRNFSAAKTARIAAAFGAALNLGRDATQPEVESELDEMLIKLVLHQERMAQIRAIADTPM